MSRWLGTCFIYPKHAWKVPEIISMKWTHWPIAACSRLNAVTISLNMSCLLISYSCFRKSVAKTRHWETKLPNWLHIEFITHCFTLRLTSPMHCIAIYFTFAIRNGWKTNPGSCAKLGPMVKETDQTQQKLIFLFPIFATRSLEVYESNNGFLEALIT